MSNRKMLKSRRAISGAVTALILVIASVIIALVVVGFAFGLFGAFGGTPTVTQIGTGTISSSSGSATFVLKSSGNVQIVSASIVGTTISVGSSDITVIGESSASLTAGVNTVSIDFGTSSNLQPGSTYTISLGLSDGATVQVAVVAQ
ncbi:hypothetical protein BFU36_09595 [Sulfolobus sp. A20]|uniref:DUF973 family protein n=1 Tax=Sulfolobaceae TaxID=118883 RepID=UPI000845F3B1|nr:MULTISPECIES: DUF973 family protein [unclassified Sulfolobus]TRM80024.1 DUF973 domain-containing protein [Sulfolobus sp. D5]TRM86247.1 DUF973 domain-containing protein [Sulfolobus sp. C3]TRM91454.1 DUF973 domain-containing protein [Sulfolobus sp. A20-N-G8]TRM97729.1 DUF973 domain-containing protein [Sulfolobus sp. F1]TRM98057.1 DUF973 domain-containing protein [Sulfolobus sp. E1]